MDRPVSTSVASPPGLDDASPSGWDAHTVWRQRVRDPQLSAQSAAPAPRAVLADRSAGWNPLETWRLQMRRLRKKLA